MNPETDYTLYQGAHPDDDRRCAMEWVAHLAGEPHSDSPKCVAHDLRGLFIALNDHLDDDERQRLRPYLTRTIGTASGGQEDMVKRCVVTADWMVHCALPELFYLDPAKYYKAMGWRPAVAGPASATRCLEHSYVLPQLACTLLKAVVHAEPTPGMFARELAEWLQVTHQSEARWPCLAKLLDRLLPLEPIELPDDQAIVDGHDKLWGQHFVAPIGAVLKEPVNG